MNIQVPDDFLRALDAAADILAATANVMQTHANDAKDPSSGTKWAASQSEIDSVTEVADTLRAYSQSQEAQAARVKEDLSRDRPTHTDGSVSTINEWHGIMERAVRDSTTDPLRGLRDN